MDTDTAHETMNPELTSNSWVNRALQTATDIDSVGEEPRVLSEIADAFRAAAASLSEESGKLYIQWEGWVYEYRLRAPGKPDEAPRALLPWINTEDKVHPPEVADFPDEATQYLARRFEQVKHPASRARIADCLWSRTRNVEYADAAIPLYIDAGVSLLELGTRGYHDAITYFARARFLCGSLRRDSQVVRSAIRLAAEPMLDGPGGFFNVLVRTLADELAEDTETYQWFLERAVERATSAATSGGQERLHERAFLESATLLAKARRDQSLAKSLRVQVAQSCEREADERFEESPLISASLLEDALKAFSDLGQTEDVERVKQKLVEANRATIPGLHVVSTEFRIPVEEIRQQIHELLREAERQEPGWHLQFLAITCSLWLEPEKISRQTIESAKAAPLQALFRKVRLLPDGRSIPRPADPAIATRFNEIEYYMKHLQISMPFLHARVGILRELDGWSYNHLMATLSRGALFPPEVQYAVGPGIRAFEERRYWEALHTLVPQVERAIRVLAQDSRQKTFIYKQDTGELHWVPLTKLLSYPVIQEHLSKIRPGFAWHVRTLLVDSIGLNLRDDTCHGIVSSSTDAESSSLLLIFILLALSTLASAPATQR